MVHSQNHAGWHTWNVGCSFGSNTRLMIKAAIMCLTAAGITIGSYYGSTELGLRSEAWREVTVEIAQMPKYDRVGHNLFAPDGTRMVLSSIEPRGGNYGGNYLITAKVRVTERLALRPLEGKMARSYSMDRPAVERALREAVGADQGKFQASEREWHPAL